MNNSLYWMLIDGKWHVAFGNDKYATRTTCLCGRVDGPIQYVKASLRLANPKEPVCSECYDLIPQVIR